jgi:hypothetical protein
MSNITITLISEKGPPTGVEFIDESGSEALESAGYEKRPQRSTRSIFTAHASFLTAQLTPHFTAATGTTRSATRSSSGSWGFGATA